MLFCCAVKGIADNGRGPRHAKGARNSLRIIYTCERAGSDRVRDIIPGRCVRARCRARSLAAAAYRRTHTFRTHSVAPCEMR